ncbi:MAG: GNAT family N-acetyltransferase [Bdellovibrionales bacterium]|nr:GNAT family N-acetyltransferase [Bdellovibrionales bacterium]
MHFRRATLNDIETVTRLYREVARRSGGIARTESEITEKYIGEWARSSIQTGFWMVAEVGGKVIGSIHAIRPEIEIFAHMLTALTIVIDPDHQGKQVGRGLFSAFLSEIITTRPDVFRIELFAKESNPRAIAFYETLGFQREGRFVNRVQRRDANGIQSFVSDTPMAWLRAPGH